jgi:hypothetical protein
MGHIIMVIDEHNNIWQQKEHDGGAGADGIASFSFSLLS